MKYVNILVFSFFVFLTFESGHAQEISNKLGGRIVTLMGDPISEAEVQLQIMGTTETEKTHTKIDGTYGFNTVPKGRFSITIKARGFQEDKIESSYSGEGGIIPFNFGLKVGRLTDFWAGIVEGIVSVGGRPIKGAKIGIVNAFNYDVNENGISAENGRFSISVREPGKYIIYAVGPESLICAKGLLVEPGTKQKKLVINLNCK
ncbi:hypothetical protein BH20ACI2_BH20ACI2_14220 [soil metagenome]